jgi:aerobic-type carbon monoxide dehydrogenase small subunit (CoxS/CutS family)
MSAHRIADGDTRPAVTLFVDGAPMVGREGEPLATFLLCAGRIALRESPRNGGPRGAFCYMGVCQECVVLVDGRLAQACMTPARDGMVVELGGAGR